MASKCDSVSQNTDVSPRSSQYIRLRKDCRILTPENAPEFVIPSLENYRKRQQEKAKAKQEAHDHTRKFRPSWSVVDVTGDEECVKTRSDNMGMTLKHMEKKTSSYGFPILTGSPRRCSESVFHLSTENKARYGNKYVNPPSSPLLYRQKLPEELKTSRFNFEDTVLKQPVDELETQLSIFENSMKNVHRISFTSDISSRNVLNVTVHNLRLPSVKVNSFVYVRVCLHIPGKVWKQCYRSIEQKCNKYGTFCLEQPFTFNLTNGFLSALYIPGVRLCFKVYQSVKGGTQYFIGNVSVPYNTFATRSHHTRCLERRMEKHVSNIYKSFDSSDRLRRCRITKYWDGYCILE